jgi:hypothetical protein
MTRTYVTEIDPDTGEHHRTGYFDADKAQVWSGAKEWDGKNNTDINTGDWGREQHLYRTAGGRWALNTVSYYQGEAETYVWATDEQARDWLMFNQLDNAVAEHFGDVPEERGPGRPEIGAPIQVRLGDLLPQVEAWAAEHGVSRAEAARRLISTALATPSAPRR